MREVLSSVYEKPIYPTIHGIKIFSKIVIDIHERRFFLTTSQNSLYRKQSMGGKGKVFLKKVCKSKTRSGEVNLLKKKNL